jgi:hypothetical protein
MDFLVRRDCDGHPWDLMLLPLDRFTSIEREVVGAR